MKFWGAPVTCAFVYFISMLPKIGYGQVYCNPLYVQCNVFPNILTTVTNEKFIQKLSCKT
jgi:hypothetical protein